MQVVVVDLQLQFVVFPELLEQVVVAVEATDQIQQDLLVLQT
jgi:hypothetical protein